MPFRNENRIARLPLNSNFQQGRSNVDNDEAIETGVRIPWASDPAGSYIYYECTVGSMLDSGITVHSHLPQVNHTPDTLSAIPYDSPNLDTFAGIGVNLRSQDQYRDIVQRMGHSRYWFRLWGRAIRVGYQVPIPSLKSIGGVPAIPYDKNPQWGFNKITPGGNYSGIIMWYAEWSLWYTTAVPPVNNEIPAASPYAHIDGNTVPPKNMQAPWSQSDDNAETTRSGAPDNLGPTIATRR